MRIAVISIGDELLKGVTLNTNAAAIGRALLEQGMMPFEIATIPDTGDVISAQILRLIPRSDHLILTGGLGPTGDDLTREAVANALRVSFERDRHVEDKLRDYWRSRSAFRFPESNLKQADKMVGASWIPNPNGTAQGQVIVSGKTTLWMLPGPPREMIPMLEDFVISSIAADNDHPAAHRTLTVCGIPESTVEERTMGALRDFSVHLAYCAEPYAVRIYITSDSECEADDAFVALKKEFESEYIFEQNLPEAIVALLREHGGMLAASESCTGGLIAAAVTAVPGSSDVFFGGAVVYSNEAKFKLGVSRSVVDTSGAVSGPCCAAMLAATIQSFETDAAIAVTGVAGPGGGSDEKPVGTVYVGVSWKGKSTFAHYHFSGNRERIRQRTVMVALETLRQLIIGKMQ